jgi:cobalt transporter subunit CbtB
MSTPALQDTRPVSLPRERSVVAALTLSLGLGLVYLVGFAPLIAVHNAAHDVRHSTAFPCH